MVLDQLTRLRRFVEALFPERHLYLDAQLDAQLLPSDNQEHDDGLHLFIILSYSFI